MESYALPVRPLPSASRAAPVVDLRARHVETSDFDDLDPWQWCREFVHRFVSGSDGRTARRLTDDTIKGFDRAHGADHHQLAAVLDALDHGRPVAIYSWWPTAEAAALTDILGVDTIEVPPPDRKGTDLVEGHAVVVLGYGRHDAFPGGGYLIVRNPWPASQWGDDGCGPSGEAAPCDSAFVSAAEPAELPKHELDGAKGGTCLHDHYLPFTYVRAYAIALQSARVDSGYLQVVETPLELPIGPSRNPEDVEIAKKARCADPRASYTSLFFSEKAIDTARAKAICSRCDVKDLCLARALERAEPYGVWGGEFLIDGEIVVAKRGRGRPRTIPMPTDVDEITGMPVVA